MGIKSMFYESFSVLCIAFAIIGMVYTIKKHGCMNFSVWGKKRERYEVINKENFNSLMIFQNVLFTIYFLTLGVTCILLKYNFSMYLVPSGIIILFSFSLLSRKYIKEK